MNTLAFIAALLCAALPVRAAAETLKVGGTGAAMRSMEILGEAFTRSHPGVTVAVVPGLGSRGGKKALLAGAIDVALSADPLKPEERDQGMVAQEYAKTAFVFAASRDNPTSGLTLPEIIDIFAGRTVNWPDGRRLRLILRPRGDSDTTTMEGISPAMRQAVESAHARPGMKIAVSDQDAAADIETIPGALGTSTLALIVSEKRPLKPLAIDGVAPTPATLASGSYPYVKTLYAITRPDPPPAVEQLIAFLRSGPGRALLARLGHWVP